MEILKMILDNIIGQWELFLRLVVACVCGAIIGVERSHRKKDAGIKTHIILAMGAGKTAASAIDEKLKNK